MTGERPALALEVVDLRLHEDGAPGERDELRVRLGVVARPLPSIRSVGLDPLLLVAGRLGARLADEHVDLDELAVERGDVVAHGARRAHRPWRAADSRVWSWRCRSPEVLPQSSGIRIQPWRIAYTTAWVRSFTDSLRRIELMWFLTVCSEIDSA